MNFLNQLTVHNVQPPDAWWVTANRYLPALATFALILTIAYELANLTWTLLPGAATDASRVEVTGSVAVAPATYSALADAHLFGEPSDAATPTVATAAAAAAPDTTLRLQLTGILFAEGGPPSEAIISGDRGDERIYRVGDAIDTATGATVHTVQVDRVILDRNGQLETLRYMLGLESAAATEASQTQALPESEESLHDNGGEISDDAVEQLIARVIEQEQTAGETVDQRVADQQHRNASRLALAVAVAPQVRDGQTVGLRVNPGEDREGFNLLGLKAGDVVTSANGTLLDNASATQRMYDTIGRSALAQVMVIRDGVEAALVIDTRRLERDAAEPE